MKFKTRLRGGKTKNVVGIVVPDDVVIALGGGKRAPVRISLKGYSYLSTLAVMSGRSMVGVAAEHRDKAKVKGGDLVEVDIVLDTAPRAIQIPTDLALALTRSGARPRFDALAPSRRKEFVRAIEAAKAEETRERRIAAAVQAALAFADRRVSLPIRR
jgi:hypothetical protein